MQNIKTKSAFMLSQNNKNTTFDQQSNESKLPSNHQITPIHHTQIYQSKQFDQGQPRVD